MTPIILPLGKDSQWPHHNESKFLFRSALKHVEKPWLIIIGHLPEWAAMEKNTTMQRGEFKLTHISFDDSVERNKDHNMAIKIAEGCKLLKKNGYDGGFIRCSDDQLFLKNYRPAIWFGDSILNFIRKRNKLRQTFKNGSANPLQVAYSFDERINKYHTFMVNTYGPMDYTNFDTHMPQWYFSPESYLDFFQRSEHLFKSNRATINSAYFNDPETLKLISKDLKILRNQLGSTPATYLAGPVDPDRIMDFMKDSKQWELLGYDANSVTALDGNQLRSAIEHWFGTISEFEKIR